MMLNSFQTLLYSRVNGDTTLAGLLGGSGRFFHGFENNQPQQSSLSYIMEPSVPGNIRADNADSFEQYFMFSIFANNYNAIAERLFSLLHKFRFAAASDMGGAISFCEWIGPDSFDEDLKCGKKQMRFRVLTVLKPQNPIT